MRKTLGLNDAALGDNWGRGHSKRSGFRSLAWGFFRKRTGLEKGSGQPLVDAKGGGSGNLRREGSGAKHVLSEEGMGEKRERKDLLGVGGDKGILGGRGGKLARKEEGGGGHLKEKGKKVTHF